MTRQKFVAAVMLVVVLVCSVGGSTLRAAAAPLTWSVDRTTREADGSCVESGRIGDVPIESRAQGSTITTTIQYKDHTEVVEVDKLSPYFTVTSKGVTQVFDRREAGRVLYEVPSDTSATDPTRRGASRDSQSLAIRAATDELASVPPSEFFGEPYYDDHIGTRIQYSPLYVVADAYENYDYYFTKYTSWSAVAWTLFSVILGWVGLTWNSLMAIIGSVVALVEGAYKVVQDVVIGRDTYRLDWTRYVTIEQDPNGYTWYWAGKTQYKDITFSIDGAVAKLVSESKHPDFDNVSTLMQTGIDNYMRDLGY